ncbi:MAG: hypothetical protein E6G39_08700, partial [Actinobacteria bacterium]
MEWRSSDGEELSASFEEDLRRDQWGARLRTALSVDGDWLPTVLAKAHERLVDIRRTHVGAGGLVIAVDQEHARAVVKLLKRDHKITARVALSDDPKASAVIEKFRHGDDPWIVAVRMISEGVDIPRLRVGVLASTTATALFFRQAVGRIARWTPGMRSQKAYFFLPDDPRLRSHALALAQERRHSIEALFQARSSTVLGGSNLDAPSMPSDGIDPLEDLAAGFDAMAGFDVELPPPPPLPGRQPDPVSALSEMRTRESEKR